MTRYRLIAIACGLAALAAGRFIADPTGGDSGEPVPALPAVRVAGLSATGTSVERTRDGDGTDSPHLLDAADAITGEPLHGRAALERGLALLREGLAAIDATDDYTATFHRRERVNGVVEDPHVCEIGVRHSPFSVHMHWLNVDRGRRAAYVSDRNDDKLLVRFGGWKARLPVLHLDPEGSTALRSSRHPMTEAGLREMTRQMIIHRQHDLATGDECHVRLTGDRLWNDRPCDEFVVEYTDPALAGSLPHPYRKSIQYIDREWHLPVHVLNYAWPHADESFDADDLDGHTFVESYAYTNLVFDTGLSDDDFDLSR